MRSLGNIVFSGISVNGIISKDNSPSRSSLSLSLFRFRSKKFRTPNFIRINDQRQKMTGFSISRSSKSDFIITMLVLFGGLSRIASVSKVRSRIGSSSSSD